MSKTIHLASLSKKAAKSLLTGSSAAKITNKSLNTTASSNSIVLNTGASSPASIAAASKHLTAAAQQRRNKAYYGTPQEFKSYNENLLLVNDETATKWKTLPSNRNSSKTYLFVCSNRG
jgi:hypothetical protein